MKNWSQRMKARMADLNLTQELVAKKINITRAAVCHYLTGRRVPPLKQMQKLATILKVDPGWLLFGTENKQHPLHENTVCSKHPAIPILTWEQATHFTKIKSKHIKEYVTQFFTNKTNLFALKIKDDAMLSLSSQRNSFHVGELIIVDPTLHPLHGNFVIALLPNTKEVIFKQYVIDGGKYYLKPLNTQYPLIHIGRKTRIMGIVITSMNFILPG